MIFLGCDTASGLALHAEHDRRVTAGATTEDALAAMLDRAASDLSPGSDARFLAVMAAIRDYAGTAGR